MIRKPVLALLVLAPAAVLAQAGALDAARGAHATAAEGSARVQRAADAPAAEPVDPVAATARARSGADRADDGLEVSTSEGPGRAPGSGRGAGPAAHTTIGRGRHAVGSLRPLPQEPLVLAQDWSYNPRDREPALDLPRQRARASSPPVRPRPRRADRLGRRRSARRAGSSRMSPGRTCAGRLGRGADTVAVAGPYKIGYAGPQQLALHESFVTPAELEASGKLGGLRGEDDAVHARLRLRAVGRRRGEGRRDLRRLQDQRQHGTR